MKENEIEGVLVSTEQSGKFADANICMSEMEDETDKSLSFENKTAVFRIATGAGADTKYVEVSAKGFAIANQFPEGSKYTSLDTIHVEVPETDKPSEYFVSILVPDGLKVGDLSFSDGTNVKGITTGDRVDEEIAAGTLYTVTEADWESPAPAADYVEIGGVKWGTCNIGADTPTEKGWYFSWGNTEGYIYDNTNQYWVKASDKTTKLSNDGSFSLSNYKSTPGNGLTTDISPTSENDAARVNLGGDWRMPTKDEFQTLYNTCIGEDGYDTATNPTTGKPENKGVYWCTNYDGVAGCLFYDGKNVLFFPAAGQGSKTGFFNTTSYYWSSTYYDANFAYYLSFQSNNINPVEHANLRSNGLPIRPIYAPAPVTPVPTPKDALFSVSAYKKVKFTKGNLYWDGSEYQFENNQYDYRHFNGETGDVAVIGGVVGTTPDGTVGSFWCISNDEEVGKPYDKTYTTPTGSSNYLFTDESNGISGQSKANQNFAVNGESGKYQVLSRVEWEYLLNLNNGSGRSTESNLFAKARVHNVDGLLIFPDDYILPSDYTKAGGGEGMAVVNKKDATFPETSIPDDVWSTMEFDGVVFLPAAGMRSGESVSRIGVLGSYLTSLLNGSYLLRLFFSGTSDNKNVDCSGNLERSERAHMIRCVYEEK